MVSLDIGVGSFAFVFDISDETVVVVGGVGHDLDTTVGKVDSANKKSCLRNKYGNWFTRCCQKRFACRFFEDKQASFKS